MIYAIYIVVTLIVNVFLAFIYKQNLNISFVPLFLVIFMGYMSIYLNNNRGKGDFNVNNFSDLNDEEWAIVSIYMSRSYIVYIPLNFPLIFFFNIYIKLGLMILILFLSVISGPVVYKIKCKK